MRIRKFSLIEVLVAVAIFAILIVLVMDIFGRATKTMSSNVQNVKVSASAKIAFDYLEDMLKNANNDDLINGYDIGKVFSTNANGVEITEEGQFPVVAMRSVANVSADKEFDQCRYGEFYFGVNKLSKSNDDYGCLQIYFKTDGGSAYAQTSPVTLLYGVTMLKLTAHDKDWGNDFASKPMKYIKIDIEMFTPEDFQLWKTKEEGDDKNFFYNNNVFVFSRIIKLP